MKRYSIMMVLTLGALLLCAQGLQAGEGVNASYTYTSPSDGDFQDEVEQHEFKAGGGGLKILHTEDYGFDLSVGGKFQANVWTFDDDSIDDIDLYKVQVPVTAGFKATDNIHVSVELTPGIHSDFEDVDGDDFRVDGAVIGTYVQSPDLQWVLGLAVGEEFGDPTAFPIIGARWQATEELLLDLIIPKPRASYALKKDLRLFAAGEPTGGSWNVGDEDVARQVDVELKGFRVGIGGEYQVVEGGWLYLMVGVEGGRELQVAVDEDEVFDDEVDLDDGTFVQIGFRVR